jgi:hypothetical protein
VKIDVRQEGLASSVAQATIRKSGQFRTTTAFSGSVQDHLCKLVKTDVREDGRTSSVAQATVRKSGQFRNTTTFSGQFRTISASW